MPLRLTGLAAGLFWAAQSAAAESHGLSGQLLSPMWVLPFVGILVSIAFIPLTAPGFWHRHYGKTSAFWALAFLIPFTGQFGLDHAMQEIEHTLIAEYIPFMVLLLALFTVAGGIHIRSHVRATPAINAAILAIGAVLASVMGTTGASMLLVRPLLNANMGRRQKAHVVIFFIFIVANIGGALTPLGDPPLFIGFLKGVDFFWTTRAMLAPTALATAILLAIFYAIDRWYFVRHQEAGGRHAGQEDVPRFHVDGKINFLLLGAILAAVLISGVWQTGIMLTLGGTTRSLEGILRDLALAGIVWASWRLTPRSVRAAHHFEWGPIIEVAKLFAAIFLTIIPAIAVLRAGREGFLAPIVAMVSHADGQPNDVMYFWLTGVLSSVLDNAPTYLVFFNLAGADPVELMGRYATTLTAISAGAVYMGAMTYIGNAPNFMVKSIAESRGVHMPSFFGYIGWSVVILLPVLVLVSAVNFL